MSLTPLEHKLCSMQHSKESSLQAPRLWYFHPRHRDTSACLMTSSETLLQCQLWKKGLQQAKGSNIHDVHSWHAHKPDSMFLFSITSLQNVFPWSPCRTGRRQQAMAKRGSRETSFSCLLDEVGISDVLGHTSHAQTCLSLGPK